MFGLDVESTLFFEDAPRENPDPGQTWNAKKKKSLIFQLTSFSLHLSVFLRSLVQNFSSLYSWFDEVFWHFKQLWLIVGVQS